MVSPLAKVSHPFHSLDTQVADQPDLLAFSDTLYAFRRNFATWVTKYVDPRFAKFFLGHQANSTMLEARYDQGSGNVNLTEGLLGPQEHQTAIVTPLSLQRHVGFTTLLFFIDYSL